MKDNLDYYLELFLKFIAWISLGIAAKLAMDSKDRSLTKRDIVIKTVLSVFVGYLTAVICDIYEQDELSKLLVPVGTLMGETLTAYFMRNWKMLFKSVINRNG